MKGVLLFNRGDLVKIKTGIFAGREGEVIEVLIAMGPDLPWDHYWLEVRTKSLDGSKVIVSLNGGDVELIDAPKTDG
jgi:hypothetical protein